MSCAADRGGAARPAQQPAGEQRDRRRLGHRHCPGAADNVDPVRLQPEGQAVEGEGLAGRAEQVEPEGETRQVDIGRRDVGKGQEQRRTAFEHALEDRRGPSATAAQ